MSVMVRVESYLSDGSSRRKEALTSTRSSQSLLTSAATQSSWLLGWFTWYSRRYIRRHFHSVRISRSGVAPKESDLPLVVYSNHASWWDPLVGLTLKAHCYPDRNLFTPMDAAALERYRLFRKLGFFPVEQNSPRGAAQFLRAATVILQSPANLLAITPQSRFADVRERPVRFEGGLGLLATRVERTMFVPFATEFVFWEERLPEILVRFGEAIEGGVGSGMSAAEWTRLFEAKMQANQDALATEVKRRDPQDFEIILRGGAGQGGVYDWWRALKARFRSESFQKEHGNR